jgi:hypothetical protein
MQHKNGIKIYLKKKSHVISVVKSHETAQGRGGEEKGMEIIMK